MNSYGNFLLASPATGTRYRGDSQSSQSYLIGAMASGAFNSSRESSRHQFWSSTNTYTYSSPYRDSNSKVGSRYKGSSDSPGSDQLGSNRSTEARTQYTSRILGRLNQYDHLKAPSGQSDTTSTHVAATKASDTEVNAYRGKLKSAYESYKDCLVASQKYINEHDDLPDSNADVKDFEYSPGVSILDIIAGGGA